MRLSSLQQRHNKQSQPRLWETIKSLEDEEEAETRNRAQLKTQRGVKAAQAAVHSLFLLCLCNRSMGREVIPVLSCRRSDRHQQEPRSASVSSLIRTLAGTQGWRGTPLQNTSLITEINSPADQTQRLHPPISVTCRLSCSGGDFILGGCLKNTPKFIYQHQCILICQIHLIIYWNWSRGIARTHLTPSVTPNLPWKLDYHNLNSVMLFNRT